MLKPQKYDIGKNVDCGTEIKTGGCTVKFNEKGEIVYLSKDGKVVADEEHRLLTLMYEQFCYDDYVRFHVRYHRIEDQWAWEDFTKIGMDSASREYSMFTPTASVGLNGGKVVVNYSFPEKAQTEMGAPELMQAVIECGDKIKVTVSFFGKPANRTAEALWVGFHPNVKNLRVGKLGCFIDVSHVVSRGARNLHATDFGVKYDGLTIESPDCALVAPGKPHLVDFVNEVPDSEKEGIYFNLYNNVWGTNFPMWYDEDTAYRFVLNMV